MIKKLKMLAAILLMAVSALSLAGCRHDEGRNVEKFTLPMVGSPSSPLPTPNVQTSPLRK